MNPINRAYRLKLSILFTEKFLEVFIATNRTKRSVEDTGSGSGSKEAKEFGEKKIKVDSDKKKGLRHFVP